MYAHALPEIHNYTTVLHKYAKLTVRESRIWAEVFFWTKTGENFKRWISGWTSAHR